MGAGNSHHPLPPPRQTRGVHDPAQQAALVAAAEDGAPSTAPSASLGGRSPAAAAADGRALLALHALLGARPDVDAASMAVKEPGLLGESTAALAGRLLSLRADAASAGRDVAALAAAAPDLLLQDPPESPETVPDRVRAWRHGLAGDGEREWRAHAAALAAYASSPGDAAVGTRSGDCRRLARWAAKQRADAKSGALPGERRRELDAVGFEFDADAAEFARWTAATARALAGTPSAGGEELFLENWMSVQRVARRSGVLSASRVAALDAVGFDWTGADALS